MRTATVTTHTRSVSRRDLAISGPVLVEILSSEAEFPQNQGTPQKIRPWKIFVGKLLVESLTATRELVPKSPLGK